MSAEQSLQVRLALVRGAGWSYVARFGGKPIALVSTLLLARLLSQDELGVAMFALTMVGLLLPLSDLGIGAAIIYGREEPETADTAFWLCLAVGLAIGGAFWAAAPLVGQLFRDARVVEVSRALALVFPLTALGQVHEYSAQKRLAFHSQVPPSLVKALAKGGGAVLLALAGWGLWSMIWGQLLAVACWVATYWWLLRWCPRLRFSLPHARALLGYGRGVVPINLLGALLLNVDFLIVGRLLGAASLGVYTIGFRLPELLIIQLGHVLNKVLFPIYARLNGDRAALGRAFLDTLEQTLLVVAPLSLGLAAAAGPCVLTFLTPEWAGAATVTEAIAVYALLLSLEFQASSVLRALGRLRLLLTLTLLRGAAIIPALWWAASGPGSLAAVAWCYAAVALASAAAYTLLAARSLGIAPAELARVIAPPLACGVAMAGVVVLALAAAPDAPAPLRLALAVAAGAGSYTTLSWLAQRAAIVAMWRTLRGARAGR